MPFHRSRNPITRREALCRIGNGFGMMAFAGLVGDSVARAAALDHPARAKHVIFLFMNGGLSQVDSFDPKPALDTYPASRCPAARSPPSKTGALMRSPFASGYGQCGMDVRAFPNVGACADDIC
jgi:hypothetical protein